MFICCVKLLANCCCYWTLCFSTDCQLLTHTHDKLLKGCHVSAIVVLFSDNCHCIVHHVEDPIFCSEFTVDCFVNYPFVMNFLFSVISLEIWYYLVQLLFIFYSTLELVSYFSCTKKVRLLIAIVIIISIALYWLRNLARRLNTICFIFILLAWVLMFYYYHFGT